MHRRSSVGNPTTINGSLSTPRSGVGACTANNVTAETISGNATVTNGLNQLSQPVQFPTPAAPNPLPNAEFMRVLRDVSGACVGLPAHDWMLEIGAVFIRTETELILKSRRVVPRRLLDSGFNFLFPKFEQAAQDLTAKLLRGQD